MGNTEQGAGTRSRGSRRARIVAIVALAALAPTAASAQFFWNRSRFDEDDAARAAIAQGFQLLSRPVRDEDVFVAEVVNRRGGRERLIIADDTGRILQRVPLEGRRAYRRFADPTIPPGPVPPGRIPDGDRGEPSVLSRLFGGDERSPADLSPPEQRDRTRPPRQRRTARAPEPTGGDTIRDTPVDAAPLAPPSAAPTLPKSVAKPAPTKPAPAQAALPPATATPTTPEPAPAAVAPSPVPAAPAASAPDRPVRSITTNPLAIPGSREQDEKAAAAGRPAVPAARTVTPVKAPAAPLPPKDPVAVAPLD